MNCKLITDFKALIVWCTVEKGVGSRNVQATGQSLGRHMNNRDILSCVTAEPGRGAGEEEVLV